DVVAITTSGSSGVVTTSIFNGDNLPAGTNLDLLDSQGEANPDGSIDDVQLRIGDSVTYRLTSTLPFASGEDIIVRDFLPLPSFDLSTDYPAGAVQIADYLGDTNATLPQALIGSTFEWTYGPDHDVDTSRIVDSDGNPVDTTLEYDPTPDLGAQGAGDTANVQAGTVYFDTVNNTIIWNFGTWNEIDDLDPYTEGATIDILFTVQVNDQPFADGLLLTNQTELSFDNSVQVASSVAGIVPLELLGPELQIRKGVIGVSPAGTVGGASFTSDGVGDSLSVTGANSEFTPAGHSEDNANPFNALNQAGTDTAEETIFGTSIGNPISINTDFTNTNLPNRVTNLGAGEIVAYVDNFGQTLTFQENANGDIVQT
ncbi:MAG: hypothetical protein AAF223_22095, partial [Bacteroidota bacterium]